MKYYIFFSLYISTILYSYDFLYPVASLQNGQLIFFIQQKSLNNINLFVWNKKTNLVENGLWSLYNPGYIQILPNEIGFSFIDNGRLRIKYFDKRSAKTIDFDEYIYNMSTIHWINSHEFYCSAQSAHNNYAIFLGNIDGMVKPLVSSDAHNYLYPQIIDDDFFYIQRTKNGENCIMHSKFSSDTCNAPSEKIIDIKDKNLIFLSMHSKKRGFVMAHTTTYSLNDETIEFQYYMLEKRGSIWHQKHLFSFNIPLFLLSSQSSGRLYESLLPLIPRYNNDKIYFVDSKKSTSNQLELFFYDMKREGIKSVFLSKNKKYKHLFVPFIIGTKLILGGAL